MRPLVHGVAALGLGAVALAATQDAAITMAVMAGEGLLDLDHLVEYILRFRHRATLGEFLRPGSVAEWPRLIFALHGYEWVALMGVLAWWAESAATMALTLGVLAHLLMDEIGNRLPGHRYRIHPLFYWFAFRWSQGFARDRIAQFR